MLTAIARAATSRPKSHLAMVVVAFIVAGIFGPPVAGLLTSGTNAFFDAGSESSQAVAKIESASGRSSEPAVIVVVPSDDLAAQADVRSVLESGPGDPLVVGGSPAIASKDGNLTFFTATVSKDTDPVEYTKAVEPLLKKIDGAQIGGNGPINQAISDQLEHDLTRAELIAFPILFIVALWVFRSLVAAAMPLLAGGMTIVVSMSVVRLIDTQLPLSTFALNLITGLGLGLSIDYSLFIISRYREELLTHGKGFEAMSRTVNTAGRTVIFSALTVAGAGASLTLFPLSFLYSMGIGTMVVALVAAGVAILGLTPVLALLGPNINRGALASWVRANEREASGDQDGFWYRWSQTIMRRPAVFAAAGAVVLILMGLPFLRIHFEGAGVSVLPAGTSARTATETFTSDFAGTGPTAHIAIEAPETDSTKVTDYVTELSTVDKVTVPPMVGSQPNPVYLGDDTWEITAALDAEDSNSPEAAQAVNDIRALDSPVDAYVGGFAAKSLDQSDAIAGAIPAALTLLAVLTFVILFVMTGSVLLPIKALVMNVLTISAAFGLMVLIFQDGRFENLLRYTSEGSMEKTQPVLIFAIAFGLSTDYAVFLLTRIKEARDNGAGERESVAIGLQRTGRIVTAAAVLFSIAMAAFATSEMVTIKELGLGVTFAVLIDAFVVRSVLVPSLMALLGRWNWWAPEPLRKLHEKIGVSEG